MSGSSVAASGASPPYRQWSLLVDRSIAAWDGLFTEGNEPGRVPIHELKASLYECRSLDEFFGQVAPHSMFWFFQRRSAFMSQKCLKKWSRDELDDYVLLPAKPGFVSRRDCYFVSHYWRTQDHPDPNGEDLRLQQRELKSRTWSYIWVDWTCMPQSPRSSLQQEYFHCCLETMPGIIRHCGFVHIYPPFEPRLWILYEITEYLITSNEGMENGWEIAPFFEHLHDMLCLTNPPPSGVRATLARYGYRCSSDRDRQHLTSWLELLIILRRIPLRHSIIRGILDQLTWSPTRPEWCFIRRDSLSWANIVLRKFEGTLTVDGTVHTFTPFPQRASTRTSDVVSTNNVSTNIQDDGKDSSENLP